MRRSWRRVVVASGREAEGGAEVDRVDGLAVAAEARLQLRADRCR